MTVLGLTSLALEERIFSKSRWCKKTRCLVMRLSEQPVFRSKQIGNVKRGGCRRHVVAANDAVLPLGDGLTWAGPEEELVGLSGERAARSETVREA